MESLERPYHYVHPEEICRTYRGMESDNTQMLFTCPCCQGKASFSLLKRVGRCFVCGKTLKLQSKYEGISLETLFSALPVPVSTVVQGDGSTVTRIDLETRPLSPQAWD